MTEKTIQLGLMCRNEKKKKSCDVGESYILQEVLKLVQVQHHVYLFENKVILRIVMVLLFGGDRVTKLPRGRYATLTSELVT